MPDPELTVDVNQQAFVATVEIHRPPNNFLDTGLITALADAIERLDEDASCRAIVLCSEGKHFCAGRNFGRDRDPGDTPEALYTQSVRLVSAGVPIVAAVQGAAVGGGLGLAMIADFRVASPSSRFSCNFSRLGFHPGFGLSATLPAVVGHQHALELMYTGRRVKGEEARQLGLCDRLVDDGEVREGALALAGQIAASAPLAVRSIRATMRGDLPERLRAATEHEVVEQARLRATEDHREGVTAAKERREPTFAGR